ncbi:pyridoxamine 5'-phosphate oxidase family protein [Ferruginibacter sp. HRS2-29]|uniref:pyridoxamine 5'-phosphate oxidase family protein n=1 Tax=Ferruginibacter sp. HRS2-29 TaxID=2487334 RepID=UPI0020CBA38D|nr:pyridoxamine 5'-phosphate oxidase family protein [Ferruginibacter sp. HRS2-29]MCP9750081.1 pyridoxamine 5'-phosphate oxidase [Ferruginibacter sp. HRS2-29]
MQPSQNDQLEKIKDLINDVRINMFITKDENGRLTGRPMGTIKVEEDGTLWFFTNEFSSKTDDISHNNEVFLSYSSPSKNSYVCIDGIARLSDDREKIKELWNPTMKAWFPEGLDDPKIQLIEVTPVSGEYWDGTSSKIVLAFNMLKAAVTGKEYSEGEHGKVNL